MNDISEVAIVGNQLLPDLEETTYRAIPALSGTGCKEILRSAMHYKFQRENPVSPTDAMIFGTAFHCAILEPEKFALNYICLPENAPNKPTKAQLNAEKKSPLALHSIGFWAEFELKNEGKLFLSPEEFKQIVNMKAAIEKVEAAKYMLEDAKYEASMLWLDKQMNHDGVPCKGRLDVLRSNGVIVDLKTCLDASPNEFARSCANMGYHIQAAHYWSGYEHVTNESPKAYAIVAVEKQAPFGVGVYVLPPDALLAGMRMQKEAVQRYYKATKTGYWAGYEDKVMPLQLPGYALKHREII